jgi:hypothetical protein
MIWRLWYEQDTDGGAVAVESNASGTVAATLAGIVGAMAIAQAEANSDSE